MNALLYNACVILVSLVSALLVWWCISRMNRYEESLDRLSTSLDRLIDQTASVYQPGSLTQTYEEWVEERTGLQPPDFQRWNEEYDEWLKRRPK